MQRIYTHRGTGELEMSGTVHLAGPQALSEIPVEVVKMFQDNPALNRVVTCSEKDNRKYWVIYDSIADAVITV